MKLIRLLGLSIVCLFTHIDVIQSRGNWSSKKDSTDASVAVSKLSTRDVVALARKEMIVIVDIREKADFERAHIKDAINFPYSTLRSLTGGGQIAGMVPSGNIVLYCGSVSCPTSLMAALKLRDLGVDGVAIYKEGFEEWTFLGLPVAGTDLQKKLSKERP